MTAGTKFLSADLGVLQQQLAEWRQKQSGRPRLPSELWEGGRGPGASAPAFVGGSHAEAELLGAGAM
jgi:hypothetical protein